MMDAEKSDTEPHRRSPAGAGAPGTGASIEVRDGGDGQGGELTTPEGRAAVKRSVEAACAELGLGGDVRIRLVGDGEMAAAHTEYCDDPTTTDVLTFDMSDEAAPDGKPVLDVDLLLCVDEAARQAASRGHALERELVLYAVHGVLHCIGHDDHDEEAYARMHAEEDRVLAAIGVGPTFARPAAEAEGARA